MKSHSRKLIAGLLCGTMLLAPLPAEFSLMGGVSAETYAWKPVTYEESPALAEKIQTVFDGDCGLYADTNDTPTEEDLALGGRMVNSTTYYARTDSGVYSYGGKQCFIYSQAVYGRLFDEFVCHGDEPETYQHSQIVIELAAELTVEMMREAQVMPGAYMRTTGNEDGSYSSQSGHSMIVLGYDETSITILEANADANGLIAIKTMDFPAFSQFYFDRKSRLLAHIIQPTDAYYQAVYGISYDTFYGEDAKTLISETTTTVAEPESGTIGTVQMTLRHVGQAYPLSLPNVQVRMWVSTDETVAAVDQNGVVTPLAEGTALVYAESEKTGLSYPFSISVEPLDWDTLGDANGDGQVDSLDALKVLQEYANSMTGQESMADEAQLYRMDINENGIVDVLDAQRILKFYAIKAIAGSTESVPAIWQALLSN